MKHAQVSVPVDREAVRLLAIQLGVREAARRTGLNESTVKSWSARHNWFAVSHHPNSEKSIASSASKPGDVLLQSISENIGKARAHLAKVVQESASKVKAVTIESAKELRDLAATARDLGPGWEARNDAASGLAVNILIVNGDMEP